MVCVYLRKIILAGYLFNKLIIPTSLVQQQKRQYLWINQLKLQLYFLLLIAKSCLSILLKHLKASFPAYRYKMNIPEPEIALDSSDSKILTTSYYIMLQRLTG